MIFINDRNGWAVGKDGTILKYIIDSNTSIANQSPATVENKLFPNPFTTTTTLQTEFELRDAELTIFNSSGQSVNHITNISGNTVILNRDNLPSGLYFMRLLEDNQVIISEKLVITD